MVRPIPQHLQGLSLHELETAAKLFYVLRTHWILTGGLSLYMVLVSYSSAIK